MDTAPRASCLSCTEHRCCAARRRPLASRHRGPGRGASGAACASIRTARFTPPRWGGCARRPRPDAPDGAAPRVPMGLIWPGESTPKGRLALPPCSPAWPAPKSTVARLVCRRCAPSPSPGSAEMRRVSRRSGVFRGARSLDRSGGGPNVFRSGQGCGNGRLPGVPLRLLAVRHSNRGSHGNSRGNELHAISHNARQPNQTGINVL